MEISVPRRTRVRLFPRRRPALAQGTSRGPAPSVVASGPAQARGWTGRSVYTLAVLTIIWAISYTDRQLIGLVLPLIKNDLRLSDTSLGLITGFAFVLFYSLLGLPIARLADRRSRRGILAAGLVVWSVMTSLTGLATNIWQLVATRFLMGAGEATGPAPSSSLVADLFGKADRPLAMSVLACGSSLAALIFVPIAGWIARDHGWRAVFMAAGYAGLALAALFVLTVHEPSREADAATEPLPGVAATARFLIGSKAYLYTIAGGSLVGVSLYASQVWHPSFLARVHHLDMAQIGAAIGVPRGVAGLVGTLLGGVLAERLGQRHPSWRLIAPGIACILALPAELVFLFCPRLPIALCGMLGYQLLIAMQFGPVYAACQSVARPAMRCMATASFLLVANLIGQILGPLTVGYLNDRWAAAFGQEAIRYSLLVGSACVLGGGVLLILGARSLNADTLRAERGRSDGLSVDARSSPAEP